MNVLMLKLILLEIGVKSLATSVVRVILTLFLKQHNIVGLYGIDTRQLTKIVRESGVMNGKIVP